MRALSLLGFLLISVTASAQPVVGTADEPCPLQINNEVSLSVFCADSGERLTPEPTVPALLFWSPDLAPLVESSPEAYRLAQSYEKSRAPRLVAALASGVLLVSSLAVDDEARPYVLIGAAVSFGAAYVFSLRGVRAHRGALSVYNESLNR